MMKAKDIHKLINDVLGHAVKKGIPAFLKRGFTWDEERRHVETIDDQATIFTVGKSYYYRGGNVEKLEVDILGTLAKELEGVKVIASGDNWAPFCGGAKPMTAKDSFLWVALAVPPQEEKATKE